MITIGPDEAVYSATKIACIVDALAAEGVAAAAVLRGVGISPSEAHSAKTRISRSQVVQCARNAISLSRDRQLAFHLGQRFHLTAYGLYGLAILSSNDPRKALRFMVEYHELAIPTVDVSFREEHHRGVLSIRHRSALAIDSRPALQRFHLDFNCSAALTGFRDVFGPSFKFDSIDLDYSRPDDAAFYAAAFACPIAYAAEENKLVFDASWLDVTPALGNPITYSMVAGLVAELCDNILRELELHAGVAGKVRRVLLESMPRPLAAEAIAKRMGMAPRTLRRRLAEEHTSLRKVHAELKKQLALKYLSNTKLTIEDIAELLGFSDAANFRHAFRRWTGRAPLELRSETMFRAA